MTSEFTQWWHRLKGHRQRLTKTLGVDWQGEWGFRLLHCSCGRTWTA